MNHGLSAATVAKIHGVLSRHSEVEKAILYGSRAKGNYKNGSDIDLTLTGGGTGSGARVAPRSGGGPSGLLAAHPARRARANSRGRRRMVG